MSRAHPHHDHDHDHEDGRATTGLVLALPDDLVDADDGTIVLVKMVNPYTGEIGWMGTIVQTLHDAQAIDPHTGENIGENQDVVRILNPGTLSVFDQNGVFVDLHGDDT